MQTQLLSGRMDEFVMNTEGQLHATTHLSSVSIDITGKDFAKLIHKLGIVFRECWCGAFFNMRLLVYIFVCSIKISL